ncbi:tellurium resistance protein [Paenibacillus sp. BIHB 4019]|uniref:Tellurium resistance protein n=1 Tax=Paenibacillus sp. BIHB 4019 TaxID=1870819 RepID=A0A1B2DHM3_9BACL|nr:TerD family protein [Paenibacillus sp. BIHB 4019]ANY67179.1 tellurium resistance protein [Paenibacillus sp. BIHB 4019]
MILTKGQKIDVTKGRGMTDIAIGLSWQADPAIDINASAFLLNQAGVCAQDEDMIFYNQQYSRQHAVAHSGPANGDRELIKISVGKIPSDIHKIAVTLTIHEGELNGQAFSQVRSAVGRIYNPINGEELGRFNFGEGLSKETAIVVGEFYLYTGEWKFSAVGSGFEGGLAALVKNFGLNVSSESHAEVAAAAEPVISPAKPNQLLKVELKKKESIHIQKSAKVTATLEWQTDKDLDLYCFYVTKDRQVGKVYYRNLGSPHTAPYIQLDGDALGHGKETIVIHRPEALSFVLFAAYSALSNGTGSFKSMKVRAVVDNHQGQTVTAPLLEKNDYAYWVAIAHIDFTDAKQMRVSHVEKYSKDGVERSPLLYEKGDFKMDVGPEEFKDDWD